MRDTTGGIWTRAASAVCLTAVLGSASSGSLMLVTGVTNIRDVIPFPRTPKHLEF